MVQITNLSRGPRGFNVKGVGKASAPMPVILRPGETADVDLHDQDHPVIQGMLDAGEISFGAVSADKKMVAPPTNGPDFDSMPDETLKAYIKDRSGADADPKADRKALMAKAKDLSGTK